MIATGAITPVLTVVKGQATLKVVIIVKTHTTNRITEAAVVVVALPIRATMAAMVVARIHMLLTMTHIAGLGHTVKAIPRIIDDIVVNLNNIQLSFTIFKTQFKAIS